MDIEANGVSIHYEKTGAGAPMILLHGNGQDLGIFDKLAPRLARNFTVYAVDSRNHGGSEMTDVYSYETMAEDVFAFVQKLGLGKVNLTGFSDGAIISLTLAMRHPEAVGRMALLGVNLKPDDFTEKSRSYIEKKLAETGAPLFRLMLEQPDIELDDARKVTTPTLIVAAEREIYRPETFTRLAEAMPDARLKIMTGHNHESYLVNEDVLYPDLAGFFDCNGDAKHL